MFGRDNVHAVSFVVKRVCFRQHVLHMRELEFKESAASQPWRGKPRIIFLFLMGKWVGLADAAFQLFEQE